MRQNAKNFFIKFEKVVMNIAVIISIVILGLFIYEIGNPHVFIDHSSLYVFIVIFLITFSTASFISFRDFVMALLEKGKYNNKDWHLTEKAKKLIQKFFFLIISVLMLTVLLEILYDFNDKSEELNHYIIQYENFLEDENHEVLIYDNRYYLENKQFHYWKENTMHTKDGFTPQFINVYTQLKNKEPLNFRNFIEIDYSNFFVALNEDMYYVVQLLTTLGYGDITPTYSIGMTLAWVSVLSAQFITIIGVILIIRDQ